MTAAPRRRDGQAHRLAAALAATRNWRRLLALLAAVVGYLALTPAPPADLDFGWDKLNHLLAFGALAFCARLGYATSRWATLGAPAAILAFGGLIEVLQHFVPGRSAGWSDLLADLVGIVGGALVAALLLRSELARGAREPAAPPAQSGPAP